MRFVPKFTHLAVILTALACAPAGAHNDRADTIKAALLTVDAARDGLLAYNHAHEPAIVAAATSADEARAKLNAYRSARDCATCPAGLIDAAFHSIAAAAAANDAASLAGMQAAVTQAVAALQPLIGGGK